MLMEIKLWANGVVYLPVYLYTGLAVSLVNY